MTLTIDSDSEYEVGAADEASLMVVDDETPLVSVVKIADAFEGGAQGLFRFSRTGDTSSTLSISYTITGTATAGTDYTALTGSATFAADEDFVDVPVTLLSDSSAEDTETVIVRVNSGVDYGAHPDAIDVVYVFDDDTEEGIIGGVVWFDKDEDGIRDSLEEVAAGYTVTLRDEWGYRIAETLTDSYGAYQFRGLAEGTYFVSVLPPLLHWFTDADAGTDDTIDSDMDVETGWSVPILLSEGDMTNTTVGTGLRALGMAILPDLSVVFTYKDGNIVGNQYLRVAKWHDAFELDPATRNSPVRDQLLRVKGPSHHLNYDFIDRDNDRFNVRIKDQTSWNNNVEFITATLRTTNIEGYAGYNEAETVISLTRLPGMTGWYMSDSMILVSNGADDKYRSRNVGVDNAAPLENQFNEKTGMRFKVSDRTFQIALGGTIIAKYGTNETPAEVKVDKVVKLHINILKKDNAAVIEKASIESDIKRMNEIYAQVGIRVQATINDPVNDPEGVDLSNGLENGTFGADLVREEISYKQYTMSAEQTSLLSASGLWAKDPTNANKKDLSIIHVYYIGEFSVANRPQRGPFGQGIPVITSPVWGDVVLMSSTTISTVLAHEAFHVIENLPVRKTDFDANIDVTHFPYNLPGGTYQKSHTVNLMVTGRGQIVTRRGNPSTVFDSVRLDEAQQVRAYARDDLVKNPS